ncbi:hypothetical protein Q1W73_00605 [Asticcacaulis sp. ZE23SCel15]|uniref:hypothetical protein n=1 Tax=Asticcacaulis sp. ZE23SCel15 TaxID=3059027 RepID=UPI00265D74D9|nr:hypothetical protein [Asticcacaulis sp. ZE23SCel15]WKL57520.1 hypothetical protein Q1W73_00605 [Asticcacaulis sp. ZE23SCel15]
MESGTHTAERYTPEERRAKLRAFADRMLDHLEDLAPPQDVVEVERGLRTGLLIERLYARVDTAERTERANPKPRTDEEIEADVAKSRAEWAAKINGLRLEREAREAKAAAHIAQQAPVAAPKPAYAPAMKASLGALCQHEVLKHFADELEDELENGLNPDWVPPPKPEPPLARFIDTEDPLNAPVQHWRVTERPNSGSG